MARYDFPILLVEDNPDHAELVSRALLDQYPELQINHVSDGEVALDYLFKRQKFKKAGSAPEPYFILLDLRLPKVDGLTVLNTIKTSEQLKHIPVIILTTSSAKKDTQKAYDLYANSYMVKPTSFKKFSSLMNKLGDYWLTANHQAS